MLKAGFQSFDARQARTFHRAGGVRVLLIQQYANNGKGTTENSSTGGVKSIVKTELEEIEEHHKVDNSVNKRIYNLAKRTKIEKLLKNFLLVIDNRIASEAI